MTNNNECFISVDVETAGPIPGQYSMLSLGACVVGRRDEGFYVELKPLYDKALTNALKVTGFDLAALAKTGERPEDAMAKLRDWLAAACLGPQAGVRGLQRRLRLVLRQLVFPPFSRGKPLRLRPARHQVLLHGLHRLPLGGYEIQPHAPEFQPSQPANHNALADARAQAETFEKLLASAR